MSEDGYFGPAGPPPPSGDAAAIESAVQEQRERRAIAEVSVAEERERAPDQYLGLPFATHRGTLTKGQSDFAAAERLLKQEPQ